MILHTLKANHQYQAKENILYRRRICGLEFGDLRQITQIPALWSNKMPLPDGRQKSLVFA
jgi:hypothetical protein